MAKKIHKAVHAATTPNCSAGVTMVEMATLLPFLLLLCLAFAEFTFRLAADNLANTAAQRAASQLASSPDTDNPCNTSFFQTGTAQANAEILDCNDRRDKQIIAARNTALNLLHSTPFFVKTDASKDNVKSVVSDVPDNENLEGDFDAATGTGVDIALPVPLSGENLRAAFQRVPIEVTVRANRFTFLPFGIGGGQVYGRARAWKEPSFVKSNPPALDCAGQVIDPANPPTGSVCGCSTDSTDTTKEATSPGASTCGCKANREGVIPGTDTPADPTLPDTECRCKENFEPNEAGECVCEPCEGTRAANCGVCTGCASGKEFVEGQCKPCVCPTGTVYLPGPGDHPVPGKCDIAFCQPCDVTLTPGPNNTCKCKTAAELGCLPGTYVGYNAQTKKCSCQTCANPNKVPNAAQTGCVCPPDMKARCNDKNLKFLGDNICGCSEDACTDNNWADGGDCRCILERAPQVCKHPNQVLVNTTVCECQGCDPIHGSINGTQTQCICEAADFCPPGLIQTPTCSCTTCNNGSVRDGIKDCKCPACPDGNGIVSGVDAQGKITCACELCTGHEIVNAQLMCTCEGVPGSVCKNNEHLDEDCVCQPCDPGQYQDPGNSHQCVCLPVTCSLYGQVPSPAAGCQCDCPIGTHDYFDCSDQIGFQGCFPKAGCPGGVCRCGGGDDDHEGNH